MARATSRPSVTRPKTVCLPLSQGVAVCVTKNWLPAVSVDDHTLAGYVLRQKNFRLLGEEDLP